MPFREENFNLIESSITVTLAIIAHQNKFSTSSIYANG